MAKVITKSSVKFIIFLLVLYSCPAFSQIKWNIKFHGNQIFNNDKLNMEVQSISTILSCQDAEKKIIARLKILFASNGYDIAEVWVDCIEASFEINVELDEGKLDKIYFVGADALQTALFRIAINLEFGIFHRQSLEQQLEPLKKKFQLQNIYYKIKSMSQPDITERGHLKHPKILYIYVVSSTNSGLGFGIDHDPMFGLIPYVQYNTRGIFFVDDTIEASGGIGIPFRKYLFEEDPKVQWVHGITSIKYSLLPIAKIIVPSFEFNTQFSQLRRHDVAIYRFFHLKSSIIALMQLNFSEYFSVILGGGIEEVGNFYVEMDSNDIENPLGKKTDYHYQGKIGLEINYKPEISRLGQKNSISLYLLPVFSKETDIRFVTTMMEFSYFGSVKNIEYFTRSRAIYFYKTPPIYNEINLSGLYMKAFFNNKYYIREAFQIDSELSYNIYSDQLFFGLFNDVSIFYDRHSQTSPFINLAVAAGPSFHLILLDSFLFDLLYAFGISRDEFSHNIYLVLKKIF